MKRLIGWQILLAAALLISADTALADPKPGKGHGQKCAPVVSYRAERHRSHGRAVIAYDRPPRGRGGYIWVPRHYIPTRHGWIWVEAHWRPR